MFFQPLIFRGFGKIKNLNSAPLGAPCNKINHHRGMILRALLFRAPTFLFLINLDLA